MAKIDITPRNGFREADLFVHVSSSWQAYKTGYGFFALNNGEYEISGRKLWISLQLLARPNSRSHLAKTFPEQLSSFVASKNLRLGITKGKLLAETNLSFIQEHLEERKKIQMAWDLYPVARWSPISFAFKMFVVLKVYDHSSLGDVIEWNTQFCQGGLPELGHRR